MNSFKRMAASVFLLAIANTAISQNTPAPSNLPLALTKAEFSPILSDLRKGNHTIFVRHGKNPTVETLGAFDRDYLSTKADEVKFRSGTCLDEEGKA